MTDRNPNLPATTTRKVAAARPDTAKYAAPSVTVAPQGHNLLTTPAEYPVRVPTARTYDYGAVLPGDLAAAVDDLDPASLGPGHSVTAGGPDAFVGPPRERKRRKKNPEQFLSAPEARVESVRAVLALLTDETAAAIIDLAGLAREPWQSGKARTPGHTECARPAVSLKPARDRVLRPSGRGTPRDRATGWPGSTRSVDWWHSTVLPAVEDLPGVETTDPDRTATTNHRATWLQFTPEYRQHVRTGVLAATKADDTLERALGLDNEERAPGVRAAILNPPSPNSVSIEEFEAELADRADLDIDLDAMHAADVDAEATAERESRP